MPLVVVEAEGNELGFVPHKQSGNKVVFGFFVERDVGRVEGRVDSLQLLIFVIMISLSMIDIFLMDKT